MSPTGNCTYTQVSFPESRGTQRELVCTCDASIYISYHFVPPGKDAARSGLVKKESQCRNPNVLMYGSGCSFAASFASASSNIRARARGSRTFLHQMSVVTTVIPLGRRPSAVHYMNTNLCLSNSARTSSAFSLQRSLRTAQLSVLTRYRL